MTYTEAVDSVFETFYNSWKNETTGAKSIVGYIPEIRWQGVEENSKPDKSKFWVNIYQQTILDQQSAFCGNGEKTYTNEGLVFVYLFCPKSTNDGMTNGRKLSIIIRDCFRSKRDKDIWFRNSKIEELPPEAHFYRFLITSEYQFEDKD